MYEVPLKAPLSGDDVRKLKVGDRVLLSGVIVTARDRAHRYLVEEAKPSELPFDLAGGVIYHCGPIIRKRRDGTFELIAAGPTTSARMNRYVPALLRTLGVRAVIGKGGMDKGVLDACAECGAVYLSAVGGAAQVLARAVQQVEYGFKAEEFGAPEGMWVLLVKDFPAVVTMDSHGRSLHDDVRETSERRLNDIE